MGWEDTKKKEKKFRIWKGVKLKLPTPVFLGFPGGLDGKESTCNAADLGSTPGLGILYGGREPCDRWPGASGGKNYNFQ